jgi:hypothetical protein
MGQVTWDLLTENGTEMRSLQVLAVSPANSHYF